MDKLAVARRVFDRTGVFTRDDQTISVNSQPLTINLLTHG
jgi:hypothetical protein